MKTQTSNHKSETKQNHTPAPWRFDGLKRVSDHTPDHFAVLGPNGVEAIADCFYGRTDDERAANARLIAAAPELLTALTKLAKVVDKFGLSHPEDRSPWWPIDLQDAKSAIAKAVGK